jgi:hypothetical protein
MAYSNIQRTPLVKNNCKEVLCNYCGCKFEILNGEFNRYKIRKLNFYCSAAHAEIGRKMVVDLKISKCVGSVFGKLTIIEILPSKDKKTFVRCVCKCGKYKDVRLTSLKRGDTKSCGCIGTYKNITHGESNTNLYNVYRSILQRCFDENCPPYHNYGGRGITVCNEWRGSYIKFRDWALLNGYKEGLEIDRRDNNGNYEPNNCRWVTRIVNQNNRRKSFSIEYNGEMKSITELSKELNIKRGTLAYELLDRKWSIEMVLEKIKLTNVLS